MELTTDAKIGIGIVVATILIIGGGAFFASRGTETAAPGQPVDNPERLVREDSPILGPADAKVTVVEFGDFECPACGALHPVLKQVKEQYADQPVRFVYRHFPLQQHLFAIPAAEASEAARAQGKFWEYHDLLFENQRNLEREDLEQYARDLELTMDEFTAALDESVYKDTVQQGVTDGRALQVNSTPTMFINGIRYTGQYSVQNFAAVIDQALAE